MGLDLFRERTGVEGVDRMGCGFNMILLSIRVSRWEFLEYHSSKWYVVSCLSPANTRSAHDIYHSQNYVQS